MPDCQLRPEIRRKAVRWRRWAVVAVVLCAGAGAFWVCTSERRATPHLLQQARAAAARKDYAHAYQLAAGISESSAEWTVAAALAGEAAAKAGRSDDAIRHYLALGRRQRQLRTHPLGYFFAAEVCRNAGRLTEAERLFREFLRDEPAHLATHERLAFLLSATGQRWESLPHYLMLIRSGTASVPELTVFADFDRAVEQRPFLEDCDRRSPNDLLVQLGLAADDFSIGNRAEAELRLRTVLAAAPQLIDGQVLLGELLVYRSDEEFRNWLDALPEGAARHPDAWYLRGLWARRHGELRVAARCFWEAVRIAPTHRRATYQLGQTLRSLGAKGSTEFENRAQQLIQLTQTIDEVLRTQSKFHEPFRHTVELLVQMGRICEACAWSLEAQRLFPYAEWPQAVLSRWSNRLKDDLPIVVPGENLALRFDLSQYPEPSERLTALRPALNLSSSAPASIRFHEESDGPAFAYFNGSDPLREEEIVAREEDRSGIDVKVHIRTRHRTRIFEQNGGGVAVLDFDADGWPDLFFPQGAVWKHGDDGPTFDDVLTDRLFRNRQGQSFADLSAAAGIVDRGYGQGCTAGDFDSDGFPDLYVANIGRNQLYRNNGDGTFSDVTATSGIGDDDWTASCAMVDLDADGLPDLYDVNYLTGPEVYKAVCEGHTCSPKVFAPAPDRLLVNRGDGTFDAVRPLADESHGKGLGVVALRLPGHDRLSLFIANDQVPDFLLGSQAADVRRDGAFEDQAFIRGVAYNQDGLAMASMGVAADDANGDGLIDLFVTTFKDEAGMLFLQDAEGLFIDAANAAGLRGPTWPFVGWGTQFLDADLDGDADLVCANGHVDDYRDEGGEYHMRPQFFRNDGAGRFVESLAEELGPFFAQKRLGRGLARLDWNGDGRMDFVVSNIGDRASLVTNVSATAGHFLNVRLHARTTARDAVGSIVRVAAGERQWTKLLLAGDGYMASNERLLQFGLGSASTVDEIRVQWPSGHVTVARQLPVNVTLVLVEAATQGILRFGAEQLELTPVNCEESR